MRIVWARGCSTESSCTGLTPMTARSSRNAFADAWRGMISPRLHRVTRSAAPFLGVRCTEPGDDLERLRSCRATTCGARGRAPAAHGFAHVSREFRGMFLAIKWKLSHKKAEPAALLGNSIRLTLRRHTGRG